VHFLNWEIIIAITIAIVWSHWLKQRHCWKQECLDECFCDLTQSSGQVWVTATLSRIHWTVHVDSSDIFLVLSAPIHSRSPQEMPHKWHNATFNTLLHVMMFQCSKIETDCWKSMALYYACINIYLRAIQLTLRETMTRLDLHSAFILLFTLHIIFLLKTLTTIIHVYKTRFHMAWRKKNNKQTDIWTISAKQSTAISLTKRSETQRRLINCNTILPTQEKDHTWL
jgi:hypothetical protein